MYLTILFVVLYFPDTLSPPSFTSRSRPPLVIEVPGGSVVFKCRATGNPAPNITWLHNGIPFHEKTRGNLPVNFRAFSIRLDDLESRDAGNYTCVVFNSRGEIRHTTALVISGDGELQI